jgi:16S rRNA (guanine966-N2)-methyltransferase
MAASYRSEEGFPRAVVAPVFPYRSRREAARGNHEYRRIGSLDSAHERGHSGPARAGIRPDRSGPVAARAIFVERERRVRVIAGTHGGRRLQAPPGAGTRPTPDRVREALFSALESQLGGPGALVGATVLDLFAGSGALGIEALSRGAAHAVFVERDRRALETVRANLRTLGLEERAEVLAGTAGAHLPTLARRRRRFDAVFVDPPFTGSMGREALSALAVSGVLHAGGVAVFEHPAAAAPPEVAAMRIVRTRRYGTVALTTYAPAAPAGDQEGTG